MEIPLWNKLSRQTRRPFLRRPSPHRLYWYTMRCVLSAFHLVFFGFKHCNYIYNELENDVAARYLGVKSPVPYRVRKAMPQNMRYGVNLAFGGAGVFDTDRGGASPNISTQIDYLADLVVTHKVYSTSNLTNSVALVSVAGNDYAHYVATNGSLEVLICLYSLYGLFLWFGISLLNFHTFCQKNEYPT